MKENKNRHQQTRGRRDKKEKTAKEKEKEKGLDQLASPAKGGGLSLSAVKLISTDQTYTELM